ncbi:nitroimidazol reductase NimA-like FMN-containing flavoprotein (pyridoxamine 5'-phosphate oxidase superfamily) [Arthrobacter stackebrandtii]|uniref:Nitroimidazol reductase NimA-like FMN-containing flavoprotein (Pyridoxamine 5'-phosphate oxidase superfamily) n=1 Tax=Arthrobacter stackebrandtii TaxID=272161 RepID=A0ABS4Z280_9MICC|nr:pyridoxamine 5'-phosphate oxidase family protein [Arthrobacter stackebrandtii]MBP2414830.1 nitroimidazol reductase NimA-like FMN-containing flavoprotein (pyridoxamine 5'-phosphate oxidase superfamily) [Arthrobacter stackebrandtii]PYG99487.1 flavin-nucleotide-binding protein [Arthrobacter stackebrandtii]
MNEKAAAARAENLPVHECWAQLRVVSVGRLAVWDTDHPDIFPVNYTVDHGTLVFRTGEGTKLSALLRGHPVALEADGVDPDTGVAWSVVVKGPAEVLSTTDDLVDSFSLRLFPWHAGHKDNFVRIQPTSVTGRRFKVTPPADWWTAYANAPHSSPE